MMEIIRGRRHRDENRVVLNVVEICVSCVTAARRRAWDGSLDNSLEVLWVVFYVLCFAVLFVGGLGLMYSVVLCLGSMYSFGRLMNIF